MSRLTDPPTEPTGQENDMTSNAPATVTASVSYIERSES